MAEPLLDQVVELLREASRAELERVLRSLTPEKFAEEGGGMGAIAHLAYHLGAIRQWMPRA